MAKSITPSSTYRGFMGRCAEAHAEDHGIQVHASLYTRGRDDGDDG